MSDLEKLAEKLKPDERKALESIASEAGTYEAAWGVWEAAAKQLTAATQAREQAERDRDERESVLACIADALNIINRQYRLPEVSSPFTLAMRDAVTQIEYEINEWHGKYHDCKYKLDSLTAANAGLVELLKRCKPYVPNLAHLHDEVEKALAAQQGEGELLDGRPVITQEQAAKMDCPFPPDEDL